MDRDRTYINFIYDKFVNCPVAHISRAVFTKLYTQVARHASGNKLIKFWKSYASQDPGLSRLILQYCRSYLYKNTGRLDLHRRIVGQEHAQKNFGTHPDQDSGAGRRIRISNTDHIRLSVAFPIYQILFNCVTFDLNLNFD